MQNLKFKTEINAPAAKVWNVLWNDDTYREWTKAFGHGGYAKTDWKEGSRVHFIADGEPGPDGMNGMYSEIDTVEPNSKMFFKHLGVLKNGEEQPLDEESRKWAGSMEKYNLTEQDGRTTLECEIDIVDDHAEFFNEAFPNALKSIKELSEKP